LRFLLHLLTLVGVALCVGFGLSWYALSDGRLFGAIRIGPWTAWHDVGTPNPDPYTRAYVARSGALQLGASEGLQFTATTDSDGQRLDRNCSYRIDGTTPVATFWTLVPVDGDNRIIARPGGPPAFNSTRIARATDGSLQLYVGKALSPRNWLEIAGEGSFSLVLTLYDTASFAGVAAAPASLPAIIREGCP
jgi:hypothetical protein